MATIHISLFGHLEVRRASGEPIALASKKARALLAFLAHQLGRQTSREQVCGLLWGDRDEPQAQGSLRQLLSGLRHCLMSNTDGSPLVTSRESIGLDASAVTVDVHDFEDGLRDRSPDRLEQSIQLYRGIFLDGLEVREAGFAEWVRDERRRLHDAACNACRAVLQHLEKEAQFQRAIEFGEKLIALEACDEEGHRALMRLHAAAGNIGLAVRQYQICREALQDELGTVPSAETERLLTKLLSAQRPPPSGCTRPAAPEPHASTDPPAGPSVVVLPFPDLSGDPAQQYFANGITEDIIIEISRFRPLSVRAMSSCLLHDNVRNPVELGRNLGVDYVVAGSVRRLADQLRLTAQLVETRSGRCLWAERFDRSQHDIFIVQDQIVAIIVGTLVGRLEAAGAERARRKPPASLAAYECVLRGSGLPIGDLEAEAEARTLYEQAIVLDPGYGRAHAKLAYILSQEWFRDLGGSNAVLARAIKLGKRAVALDESDSFCHDILGWLYLQDRSFELAEHHKRRALALTPNSAEQVACMGVLTSFLGKPDEAIDWFAQARRLDPYYEPAWFWRMQGIAHFVACRHSEAIICFNRSPTSPLWLDAYLAACHALIDERWQAKELATKVLDRDPGFSAIRLVLKEPYRRQTDADHLLEGLRRAGLPE